MRGDSGLTPHTFAKLLQWLLEARKRDQLSKPNASANHSIPDEELAGQEYEMIREKLVSYFARRACSIPLELADKTITRVAGRITADEAIMRSEPEPARFFYNTARYVFLEYLREKENEGLVFEDLPPSQHPSVNPNDLAKLEEEMSEDERRIECLKHCKTTLPSDNWELIIEYYRGETAEKIKNRKLLAEKLMLSPNALNIRAHRIRKRLEECLNNCFNGAANSLA
jgi:DNA-directed RNA polymerase specialized sigma24 family protein